MEVLNRFQLEQRKKIRQAVEVLTGKEVSFPLADYESGRATLRVGDDEEALVFNFRGNRVIFTLGDRETCYAEFQDNGEVFVTGNGRAWMTETIVGLIPMRWAGSGIACRRFESTQPKGVMHIAQRLGISVKRLLAGP